MRTIDTRVGGTISNKLSKKQDARQALTRATWARVCKRTQHNVCIYRNFKASECGYVYIEVRDYILQR